MGIPPSIDRQERTIGLVLAGAVLLVAFLALMYLVLHGSEQPMAADEGTGASGNARLEAYLAEKERASAYAVVRNVLDQRSMEPEIDAVFCRDSRHRWIDGHIEFNGDVDFQGADGLMRRHVYRASLRGSAKDGWTVESIQVQLAEGGTPF